MTKTLFVCYKHGCRGEFLSHKISMHKFFTTLKIKSVNKRTIILNDYFGKQLLKSWLPDFKSMQLPSNRNIVIPSHFFYDTLKNYFPNAYFLCIDIPKDNNKYRQELFDRFYNYKTEDRLEIVGYCEDRMRKFYPNISKQEINKFTYNILKNKELTFGDIHCLAYGISPTEENKKMLIEKENKFMLSNETKQNSFVIPYEKVQDVDVEEIINYIK